MQDPRWLGALRQTRELSLIPRVAGAIEGFWAGGGQAAPLWFLSVEGIQGSWGGNSEAIAGIRAQGLGWGQWLTGAAQAYSGECGLVGSQRALFLWGQHGVPAMASAPTPRDTWSGLIPYP